MNKKILALALIPAALFFACSADGTFDTVEGCSLINGDEDGNSCRPIGNLQWSKDAKGGGGNGSCTVGGYCVADDIPKSYCDAAGGTFNPGGTCGGGPNTGGVGSCTIMGQCISADYTRDECEELGDYYGYSVSFVLGGRCN